MKGGNSRTIVHKTYLFSAKMKDFLFFSGKREGILFCNKLSKMRRTFSTGSIETSRSSSEILDKFIQFESNYPDILETSHVDGEGWIVAEHCIPQDYNLFGEFVKSTMNTRIPKNVRTSFIDGTIYIKKVPHHPHEQGVEAMRQQLIITMNARLHARRGTFRSHGSADHYVGEGGQAQVDFSLVRGSDRKCPNLVVEISGMGNCRFNSAMPKAF